MSAYLMTQLDTVTMAVYAKNIGLVLCEKKAATMLRSANNAALKARYNDKPVRLTKSVSIDFASVKTSLSDGITTAGIKNADLTRRYLLGIAQSFCYQCSEGDCDKVPGYVLINKIIDSLEFWKQ